MRTIGAVAVLAIWLISAAALPGCLVAAAGAGAGTYAYVTGAMEATEEHPLDTVYAAAAKAVEKLDFKNVSSSKDALEGLIKSETADGTSVKVRVEKVTDSTTKITIRVGTFGDEAKSAQVLEAIRKEL